MQYNIRGENIEVTDALKTYVEKKVSKLQRYFEQPISEVHVKLKVYNDEQHVEVTIPMSRLLLRAEEINTDMYASVDLVVDKLERQIRKHKTRVNRKYRQEGSPKHLFADSEAASDTALKATTEEELDDDLFEVVRTKRFNLKPMDSEEAILQMNMLGHTFFVFTNAITNVTNVVYKRKDGRYGLIEPN
ncbi:ribosome hibernation-promoting factor, HPF/YfiA family [Aureibacillus halotolerans]|uniref:Ribosome hibernation promoting factor n=1 Tax=Aureibacillus halotolerans TaxID=1508390 RepID=A0A4R6U1I9_9BACI|nr:ribosome-associated translation inhibitor RaiA [Aureibacillus halotolerans]TDQ36944.1 SSU ribosomal protein S30P /sigma 54 modulation protein [Aureibacillus halotolerans]